MMLSNAPKRKTACVASTKEVTQLLPPTPKKGEYAEKDNLSTFPASNPPKKIPSRHPESRSDTTLKLQTVLRR